MVGFDFCVDCEVVDVVVWLGCVDLYCDGVD